jgi:hypothetical protein
MNRAAVDVHFDRVHMFIDMSDGPAVQFPLDWFPVLQAATAAEREHFAISLDSTASAATCIVPSMRRSGRAVFACNHNVRAVTCRWQCDGKSDTTTPT